MLKLCVEAELPLVAVNTRDVLNLQEVLKEITKREVEAFVPQSPVEAHKLYMYLCDPDPKVRLPLTTLYTKMMKNESTLLLINPPVIEEPMFHAGEVPVPRPLMMRFMKEVVNSEKKAVELLRGLGGCTLKDAAELARLTMARDKSLTVPGLMETRKTSFQSNKGLTQVDPNQGFYDPPEPLSAWVEAERKFFLTGDDPRLIPRGLLFDGPPGTGKTAGAKWVAAQLGVPLYRVDVGATKSKWLGESEGNLLASLNRVDAEEPACVLIDEIEKVFGVGEHGDSGTTTTMLSQLLWWLAERRTRTLAIMTTNNSKALPKELYREGRVDTVLWFAGLNQHEAIPFVESVLATFPKVKPKAGDRDKMLHRAFKGAADGKASQAVLTQAVYAYVKSTL